MAQWFHIVEVVSLFINAGRSQTPVIKYIAALMRFGNWGWLRVYWLYRPLGSVAYC